MENNQNTKYDLGPIVANIEKVKAMKAARAKKPSTSIKPLKFDISPDDSALKTEIVRRINDKNLTYSDIYNYCTKIKNGDCSEGQKMGYNIISGLKNRHTMIDNTFLMLCDFLNLDIMLCERKPVEDNEEENGEE